MGGRVLRFAKRHRTRHRTFRKAVAWAGTTLALLVLLVVMSQVAYTLASAMPALGAARSCAVLVLGYPGEANGSPGAVQRFRVEAGVSVYRKQHCERIILSGGAVSNAKVEADSMAGLAASLGIPREAIIGERRSRTTWENVGCSTPYLLSADRVFIVSDSLHARRARRYACRQSSNLCARTVAAGAVPPLWLFPWNLLTAANELRVAIRDGLAYGRDLSKSAPACPTSLEPLR
jgi:uncharacterized SAM-binding protein YcdF (DUF218 family)